MIPASTPSAGAGTPMVAVDEPPRLSVAEWRKVFGSISQHTVYEDSGQHD